MRDYALTALIFSLLPVCVLRPWIGILVWYWFGLMNPHRLTWDFAFSMPFAMWIGSAVLLGTVFAKDRQAIPWNVPLRLLPILFLYFTFTTFFAWAPFNAWIQWEKVAKIILMTFVACVFIHGRDRIRALLLVVALSVGFYGVKGFFFVLRSGGTERVLGPEGSFVSGNTYLGLGLSMVIPLLVMLGREEQRTWSRRGLYVAAAMCFVSTIFTYSRGAYLGLGAIAFLLLWHAKRKLLAALLLVPVLAIGPDLLPNKVFDRADLIANYEEDRSAMQRLQSWTAAYLIARDHPITGAGFELEFADDARLRPYLDPAYSSFGDHLKSAHSLYFQVLGQHGFVGLALNLAMLIATLLSLRRTRVIARRSLDKAWLATYALGIQIGFIGYLVAGAFISVAYFDLAYLFVALTAIFARELAAETEPKPMEASSPPGAAIRDERLRAVLPIGGVGHVRHTSAGARRIGDVR